TVEMYGRTKNVDEYGNAYGKINDDDVKSASLPPPVSTKYPDFWPTTLIGSDGGDRLLIGTQVSSAVVTSCIRLDIKMMPSIGSINTGFNLTMNDSLTTKIFPDMKQLETGSAMAIILKTSLLRDTFILHINYCKSTTNSTLLFG
ncbi:hypothetical protein BGW37DRAFT_429521, partial [Umbelopsis sp. PMI_123]